MTDEAAEDQSHTARSSRAGIVRAGALVAGAGLLSRALGWLRLIVITALFGATGELDAYFVAFRIPDAVFQLLAGGVLASVLVPAIAARMRDGADAAWRTVAGVANVLLLGLAALSLAAAVGAPMLVPLIAPGFDSRQLALAIDMTRLMLVSPICFSVGAVAASVLQSQHRFGATAAAPVVYNLSIIGAALVLSGQLGVFALAIGVAAGALGYAATQVGALVMQTAYRHRRAGSGEPGVGRALRAVAPRSLGLAGTQLVFIVITALASTLGVGAVTAYTIAFTLLVIPVGLVAAPLGMVLFPSLARAAADNSVAEFRRVLLAATRYALWAAAGLTALAMVLHRHAVDVLFAHGALDPVTLDSVSRTAVVLFAGIGPHSVNLVTARAFYAWDDTRTPVALTIVQVGVTVVLALATVGPLGLPGLALAVAAGSWLKAVAMLFILSTRRGLLDGADLLASATRFLAAGVACAGSAAAAMLLADAALGNAAGPTVSGVVVLAVAGSTGLLVFLTASAALRLSEVSRSLEMVRMVVRRR